MVSHFDLHDSACYNVLMSEEWRVQSFAVQQYAFDVFVAFGVVLHHDAECLFIGEIDHSFVESRTSDRIHRFARAYLIESHRVEYVPCRHLSAVFIAGQPVDVVGILAPVDTVH